MDIVGRTALLIVLMSALILAFGKARGETQLTDFNGSWQGGGTDRETPFEAKQQTSCHASINADRHRMASSIVCNGAAGLIKAIQLNISTTDDTFSGNLTQRATRRGEDSSELNGSVSGHKTNTTANFRVSFSGLTPSVDVTLRLNNPSSFSMTARTLGGELMDVTFKRLTRRSK